MKRVFPVLLVSAIALALFAQGDVPAHHTTPPKKGENLPPILPKEALWGPSFSHPVQVKAYEVAAMIPGVLYQQPCYCHCDRSAGHTSLRTCFESTHAAHCSACMKEAFYAYKMTKQGKTPAQIRRGIVRGDWQGVDLEAAANTR